MPDIKVSKDGDVFTATVGTTTKTFDDIKSAVEWAEDERTKKDVT